MKVGPKARSIINSVSAVVAAASGDVVSLKTALDAAKVDTEVAKVLDNRKGPKSQFTP
jgi:hypothetical protein